MKVVKDKVTLSAKVKPATKEKFTKIATKAGERVSPYLEKLVETHVQEKTARKAVAND